VFVERVEGLGIGDGNYVPAVQYTVPQSPSQKNVAVKGRIVLQ
jgi:hypothetical protein